MSRKTKISNLLISNYSLFSRYIFLINYFYKKKTLSSQPLTSNGLFSLIYLAGYVVLYVKHVSQTIIYVCIQCLYTMKICVFFSTTKVVVKRSF